MHNQWVTEGLQRESSSSGSRNGTSSGTNSGTNSCKQKLQKQLAETMVPFLQVVNDDVDATYHVGAAHRLREPQRVEPQAVLHIGQDCHRGQGDEERARLRIALQMHEA
jgi:hypothetical protein